MFSGLVVEIHFLGHQNYSSNMDSVLSANISMNEHLFWADHNDMSGTEKYTCPWKRKMSLPCCHTHRDWLLSQIVISNCYDLLLIVSIKVCITSAIHFY